MGRTKEKIFRKRPVSGVFPVEIQVEAKGGDGSYKR